MELQMTKRYDLLENKKVAKKQDQIELRISNLSKTLTQDGQNDICRNEMRADNVVHFIIKAENFFKMCLSNISFSLSTLGSRQRPKI